MIKVIDKSVDQVAVLALEGKLTGLEGRGVIQEKVRESTKGKINNVVLDLHRVTWIDSTGLGELIASLSSTKKNGGTLVLTNIQAPVQSLLKMTNLDQIFDTFDSVDEAVIKLTS
ncbi:STAS domain-containing protein [bacterium]|nr:STAS domain-containing protein [bacterium]